MGQGEAVDLWRRSRPRSSPKLSVRVPDNICYRFHANEWHTVHVDISRQSQQKNIPEEAGRPLELLWRRERPHFVEQHGGAYHC